MSPDAKRRPIQSAADPQSPRSNVDALALERNGPRDEAGRLIDPNRRRHADTLLDRRGERAWTREYVRSGAIRPARSERLAERLARAQATLRELDGLVVR